MKTLKHSDKDLNERILQKAKQYVHENDVESEDSEDVEDKSTKRKATEEDLKRKREKNRLKKLRKRQQKRGLIPPDEEGQGQKLAMNYLKLWHEHRDIWKFQKGRQIWLLKHMYNKEKMLDSDFEILLQYLATMKGSARDRTLQQAESLIKKYDEDESKTDGKDTQLYTRAREVVQLLV